MLVARPFVLSRCLPAVLLCAGRIPTLPARIETKRRGGRSAVRSLLVVAEAYQDTLLARDSLSKRPFRFPALSLSFVLPRAHSSACLRARARDVAVLVTLLGRRSRKRANQPAIHPSAVAEQQRTTTRTLSQDCGFPEALESLGSNRSFPGWLSQLLFHSDD